jgi:ubiquinone/menaquinone biosynthesis C-methylase UbiE
LEQKPTSFLSKFVTGFMTLFFRLLYHPLAWSYDLVAATVSLGRWQKWVKTTAGLLAGPRVLELGFGPGHMQVHLEQVGFTPFGLDESAQMARRAHRSLLGRGQAARLARGLAQHLPFADASFNSVVATFPTQYIYDPSTLGEIRRVLKPGAPLVVLMTAWITGHSLPERLMHWLFNITGESPPETMNLARVIEPYTQAGFQASVRFVEPPGSRLMFIIAKST